MVALQIMHDLGLGLQEETLSICTGSLKHPFKHTHAQKHEQRTSMCVHLHIHTSTGIPLRFSSVMDNSH